MEPFLRTAARRHLLVVGLLTALSLLLSWPLPAQLSTHVPGVPQWAFDEATFVWNIWHFKHALIDHLRSPLHSELIWYPLGIDLVLYTYNFYHVLAALPLALATSLPLASNVTLLASTVLSGYGTWLLASSLLAKAGPRRPSSIFWGALGAGLLYAFASNRAVYTALGHYDMVTTQWIPFYTLALLRALDPELEARRRRLWAVLGGLFFALTGLAEMISALFLAIFTLLVLAVQFRRLLASWRAALESLLWLGLVAFLVWAPALLPIVHALSSADYTLSGWGDALALSTDLLGWFTATVFHPLWGGDVVQEMRLVQQRAVNPALVGLRDINTVFLGWVTLALALLGSVLFWRTVRLWVWTSLVFGVLTLGPLLQINGRYRFDLDGLETTFPLPFALLHFLPIVQANRAPNRNSVLLMLGLALLVGYALCWLLDQLTRRVGWQRPALASLLAAALIFEHLAWPLPLSDARVPAIYAQIAAEPGEFSLLQLPLGWRNSFGVLGPEKTLLQYYQTAHGKPMLGGNISRAPAFKMDYFARIPYFQALTEIEFGRPLDPATRAAAAAQAADLLYLYNTRYVLRFPPIPDRPPYTETWAETWAFVQETLPLETAPFWAQDGVEAWRVVQPTGGDHFELALGTAGSFPYRGEGWDEAEVDSPYGEPASWATEPHSRLFVPLRQVDAAATYTVRVRAHPFTYPGSPAQQAQLTVNGQPLASQPLAEGWQEVVWELPGRLLVDGLNRLELGWAYTAAPRTVLAGDRTIGNTGISLPVDVDLKAFADGGFIALFDEQGEQSDGSAGRRGVNLTVLDPRSGRLLDKAGFDTAASATESDQLVAYLHQIEAGSVVLAVTSGDATAFLSEAALQAMQRIGADLPLSQVRGQYFAVAGVAGAAPGTAVQVIDDEDAFLRVSLNRDRRTLAAAVARVTVTGP
ncbi:MAG: hypothetical protein KGS73_02230 [Chloroflexi bacterium]|nr:hypothetical protein [Chloroflexota bacterium]